MTGLSESCLDDLIVWILSGWMTCVFTGFFSSNLVIVS